MPTQSILASVLPLDIKAWPTPVHELVEGHSYFDDGTFYVEISRADQILIDRGLSTTEIEILKLHYADVSYADLARERGGTPDKYRKIVQRALLKVRPQEG